MAWVGQTLLAGALALFLAQAVIAFFGRRLPRGAESGLAVCQHAASAALLGASGMLLLALMRGDFHWAYVAAHASRTLAAVYRLAAFWAGAEGSLLLWLLLMSLCASMALRGFRRRDGADASRFAGVLALLEAFFTLMVLCESNPFKTLASPAADGAGLNPLLRNPAMIWHPPLLILGYAAFAVPFAAALASLFQGDQDPGWTRRVRGWSLFAWATLLAGIVLGAQWAYLELGWGGYWAWDPVENASLIPWLCATAFLHFAALHRGKGLFPRLCATLAISTFSLCVFGTFLTRSGVLQSVHAFPKSGIGLWLELFLGVVFVVAAIALLQLRPATPPEREANPAESATVFGAGILLAFMAVVLYGTVHPLLPGWLQSRSPAPAAAAEMVGQPVGVSPPGGAAAALSPTFFNRAAAPTGMFIAGLLAILPALRRRRKSPLSQLVRLGFVLLPAAALAGLLLPLVHRQVPAAILFSLCAAAAGATIVDFFARKRSWREGGVLFAHLGLLAVIVGLGASGWFTREYRAAAYPGDLLSFGGERMRFDRVDKIENDPEKLVLRAIFTAPPSGAPKAPGKDTPNRAVLFAPEVEVYRKIEYLGVEVDIRSSLLSDHYLSFFPMDPAQGLVVVEFRSIPLALWIWLGGGLAALGGLWAALPSRRRRNGQTDAP